MPASLSSGPHAARTRERAALVTLATSLCFVSGCGPGAATPMPEPPPYAPMGSVNIDLVGPPLIQPASSGDAQELDGKPGAVPGNAVLRVTNLDGTDKAYATTAFSDGHFSIVLPVKFGNELRFETLLDGQRLPPVDVLYLEAANGGFRLQPSLRFECAKLTPDFGLDFGAAQSNTLSLQIVNQCPSDLSIDSQSLRRMLPDFNPATPVPLTIPLGTSATLDVTYTRASNASVDDTLFFNLTQGATTIRYPVTLSADP